MMYIQQLIINQKLEKIQITGNSNNDESISLFHRTKFIGMPVCREAMHRLNQ